MVRSSSGTVMSQPLIDARALGKPREFHGEESFWVSRKFAFEACLGALDATMLTETRAAAKSKTPALVDSMTEDAKKRASQQCDLLALTWKQKALALIQLTERNDGFEGWRSTTARMELDTPRRHLAMTQELMQFNMKTGGPIERVRAFEVWAESFESQSGTFVDELMKVAKMLEVAPDDAKNSVLMGVTDLTACDPARRVIMTVLQGKRSWLRRAADRGHGDRRLRQRQQRQGRQGRRRTRQVQGHGRRKRPGQQKQR